MPFTQPRPGPRLPYGLIDTAPMERGIDRLGNALATARNRENLATIGQEFQGGNYAEAADMAARGGYLPQAMQMRNALAQRNARAEAAKRAAAQDEESKRRFDLQHKATQDYRGQSLGLQRDRLGMAQRRNDPNEAYRVRAQQAQQFGLDPRSREGREFVLTGRMAQSTKSNIFTNRHQAAVGLGLQPGTEEHKNFVLTGKVSKPQTQQGSRISAGLQQLAKVPTDYGSDQLERSIGPLQGGETYVLSPLARAWGSLQNGIFGGENNTTEIRARVAGDVEALAATIKPLIRGPGEGVWTDSDQRRLVSVVGDLAQARSTEEYKRALNNVRDRVMANFGVQLPEIKFEQQADNRGAAPRRLRYNPQSGELE